MQSASIFRRHLFTLLPLALLLASAAVSFAQTVITSLPYTITAKGLYVLNGDLSSSQTSGSLITVAASNVTIDLQGHYLSGPASYGSSYTNDSFYGVYPYERANVTIRNGTISHCRDGNYLTGNGNDNTTNNLGQILDSLRVNHCVVGILLEHAPGSRVTNC